VTTVTCKVEAGVGWVVLDRPEQLNAITVDLGRELEAALRSLGARDDVHVIAVRGAGGNFSAGGDFGEVQRLRAEGPDGLVPLFANFGGACRAVGEIAPPVVAVVEGVAMAGGFEFMLAADVVLVRDDAKICDNHINYGQIPGGGSSQRLPRVLGRQRALALLLSGDRLSGKDAAALGLAHHSFPADEFESGVTNFLSKMAARRPDALAGIKRLVYDGLAGALEDGLDLELERVVAHISGEAGGAGVDSFTNKQGARP